MIFEHSNDAILIFDSSGKVMDFNRNAINLLFPSSGIFSTKSERSSEKSACMTDLASRVQKKWDNIEAEHHFFKMLLNQAQLKTVSLPSGIMKQSEKYFYLQTM